MLKNLYTKLTGDPSEKQVQRFRKSVEEKINPLERGLQKLSDAALRAKTDEFRARLNAALDASRHQVAELQTQISIVADADERRALDDQLKAAQKKLVEEERAILDEILPDAFACAREASIRTVGMRHFDVQLIGGMTLHEGKIAEMKTGEGKTLVATAPLYLNALLGRGAHLVTVNDYLARRDAQWMGPIYHALGLSVGIIQQGEGAGLMFDPGFKANTPELNFLRACARQDVYRADITYGTNSEFGFDYLRDNMAWRLDDRVQRELYYAIVDEVDNILIDEARTPLIISGPAGEASDEYYRLAEIVRKLAPDDFTIDQRTRGITLTEAGYDRVEELLNTRLTNPDRAEEVDTQQAKTMHHLEAALKAEYLFKRDKDYIVRKGQVIIVDEFTGRLMAGRRWSDGLHQAVEAKERLQIQQESVTYATVTLQNYFRLYHRLAGMTGTAKTEEDEFQKVYNLDVIVIPTNKPMRRTDQSDLIYRNEEAKWRAVAVELAQLYASGQPTLVGTAAVEASERLSKRLSAAKLQTYARTRLLQNALETNDELSDKQRGTLKTFLSRTLDDVPENYEEVLAQRLFHAYDVRRVNETARKFKVDVRELARLKTRARGKDKSANLSDRDQKELDEISKREIDFAVRLIELDLRLDSADALCEEIAAHPDDLAKIASKFGLAFDLASQVYQELRLARDEMLNVNRALIDALGDVETVRDEFRVRASDLDVIIKRLALREQDVNALAKKLGVNVDPLAVENLATLRELFAVDSAQLADVLRGGIPHQVLNAKEHEREAHVIARAGEPHSITVATNMAGRGVDIKLGGELSEETIAQVGRVLHREGIDPYNLTFDQIADALAKIPPEKYALDVEHVQRFQKYILDRARVRELGGLRIVGTERHEARRIDNQLRGRSGRQGDAGASRFYVSLEDEIMRRMGGKSLMDRVWTEDIPLEHDWVSKSLEQAQVKMEGYNFDIRKHLLDYDDVLNKQREIIYGQRYRILTKADLRDDLRDWFEEEINRIMAETLKGDVNDAPRVLAHLDSLLPGFYLNETEFWSPFSLDLVARALSGVEGAGASAEKILDAAQAALEAHRDYITDTLVPEAVETFQQQYKIGWDEIEDLTKNSLKTIQDEAREQNRALDARALAQALGQTTGLPIELRVERGVELSQRDIVDAARRAFDARTVEQITRRVSKRIGQPVEFRWKPDGALNFDAVRDDLAAMLDEQYTKQAEKLLDEMERELAERVKSADDARGTRLAFVLFNLAHTRTAAFDSRTHRRLEVLVPRFAWTYLAAQKLDVTNRDALRDQVIAYWTKSLAQIETVRGGTATFNDLLRELMLSVVTNLWVDYLTAIEQLREGIGLQAYCQRNPLVEYQRSAAEMFKDLYARIRSQVVSYAFTYQYRGFARLASEARDRASRQAVEEAGASTQKAVVSSPKVETAKQKTESAKQKVEPARKPVNASAGAKIGRNDPCWCGSGKKYKNCHMASDAR
ncbi:MAG: SEC-C domain-containing protein [Chloroflexi bacterium]|nr:SEC-C domain-containing protein [Chloroflexota bacterium]